MSWCGPSRRQVKYDVFLSFRGKDTRKNIISHLHKELVRQGIRTFKDDETLETGDRFPERLREAINTSRFAIVVISKNYADSRWCLEELRMIMKLEREKKIDVIPVFYEVNISDVRDHRSRFSLVHHHKDPKIPLWKDALTRIANTQASESKDCKDDAALVERLVEHVSDELVSMLPMDLGDIVGMEADMDQIEHLLDMTFTTNEVRMVGIWGMVGIGKTAIAKNLYEKHKHHFKNHHCFMEKVSSLKHKGPLFLQKQLLSNILGKKNFKLLNLGQGAPCIKSRLVHLKSLIVIDDVDDVKQLDALAKEASWFGPGSRIIITTRDRSLLKSSTCAVYKVGYLKDDDKALQIFQRSAFQGAEPQADHFKHLSKSITELAQGLPFALEAFGMYLHDKSVVDWRDALESFKEAFPENTLGALENSYDGLDKVGKTAFLHVACLFNGEPVRRVKKLLQQREVGMRVLEEKSLIELSADEHISMHRLLEQMGKNIVRQESNNNPCQQRILWHRDDILRVLGTNTSKHLIEGVVLDVCALPAGVHINWDVFKPMHNLNFLKIYNSKQSRPEREDMVLEDNLSVHKLRLLHWDAYPFTTLPTSISPDCLVELKLCYSKLETLWSGTPKLVNLMKLDLTGSKNLTKLPNLKEAKYLEELILRGCSSLERIPHSICKLSRLQKLDVSKCDRLENLKISISESKDIGFEEDTRMCLRSVFMFFFGTEPFVGNALGCSLTDPSIRGNLQIYLKVLEGSAEHLSFVSENHECHEVELKSPPYGFKSLDIMRFEWTLRGSYSNCDSFSGFPWLHELNLINLNIQKIPDDIDHMQVLEKLDLSGNMFKRLPTTMSHLTKLKHLTLSNCRSLAELPGLCQVERLTLSDCTNLRTLVKKDQEGTYSLLELWLDNCKKIESLPNELSHFTKLAHLDLSRQDFKIISSKMVGDLTSLVTLSLNYCNYLVSLSGLPLSLKCLNAHGCKSLKTYSLQAAHSIDHLDLSPCHNGKDYSTFTRFPAGRRSKEVPVCACPSFQEKTTRRKDIKATCSHISIFLRCLKSLLWKFFLCILVVVLCVLLLVITDPVTSTTLLMIFLYLRL